MITEGQIVLFQFPQVSLDPGKLRPALVIGCLPGNHNDWLICMISTQVRQHIQGFDELLKAGDVDFKQSGLKTNSVIRVGRLAVVNASLLTGAIGEITPDRLAKIKNNLSNWLLTGGP